MAARARYLDALDERDPDGLARRLAMGERDRLDVVRPTGVTTTALLRRGDRGDGCRRWGTRVVGLVVTGVGLYVVAPSLLTVLDAWPSLGDVKPAWFGLVAVLELASFACLWLLLRIALGGGRLLDIAASQLAGGAAGKVVPGGIAAGGVVQAGMLVKVGFTARRVGGVLSSTGLLSTGVLLALPVLAVPAVLLGPPPARRAPARSPAVGGRRRGDRRSSASPCCTGTPWCAPWGWPPAR